LENLDAPTNNSEQAQSAGMLADDTQESTAPTSAESNPQDATTDPAESQSESQSETPSGAPEKYELTLPEGQEFDPSFMEAYETAMKDLDLPQEAAQGLIEKIAPALQQHQLASLEAYKAEWTSSSQADKEFGGDKLKENLAVAKTALEKLGTPELQELIDGTGLGNHPEVIRFFYRTGKALSEDTFVGVRKEAKGPTGPLSFNDMADRLYQK
jgi:hypothetical protein